MPRHDQLFKDLFRTFFGDLVCLVAPDLAEHLDLDRVTFHDKELFTDLPEGDRAEVDLLAEVPVSGGPTQWILVHIEVEGEHRTEMGLRMWRYHRLLRLRYPDRSVLPIVVYLRGGRGGVHVREVRERLLDRFETGVFRYFELGLSRASAADYVERPEALAWALAALMAWPSGDAIEHKLACLRPIALADLNEAARFQLFNIVETYVQLTDDEAERWSNALASQPEEVTIMEMTWAEQMMAKGEARGEARGQIQGRMEGIRHALARFLVRRFGPLPESVRNRLEAIDDAEALDRLTDRAVDAKSLDELDLS